MLNSSKSSIKVKMQKNQSHFNTKINTSQNNFATASMDINKTMKVKFSSTETAYSNIGFHKTSNDFSPDTHIKPTDEDIYYDEVIYYDGGDVYGYGDD